MVFFRTRHTPYRSGRILHCRGHKRQEISLAVPAETEADVPAGNKSGAMDSAGAMDSGVFNGTGEYGILFSSKKSIIFSESVLQDLQFFEFGQYYSGKSTVYKRVTLPDASNAEMDEVEKSCSCGRSRN